MSNDKAHHEWFDCSVPEAIEVYGATVNCPDCGREWLATKAGWRTMPEGTVREADQTKAKHREPAPGLEALPEGIQRKANRLPHRVPKSTGGLL